MAAIRNTDNNMMVRRQVTPALHDCAHVRHLCFTTWLREKPLSSPGMWWKKINLYIFGRSLQNSGVMFFIGPSHACLRLYRRTRNLTEAILKIMNDGSSIHREAGGSPRNARLWWNPNTYIFQHKTHLESSWNTKRLSRQITMMVADAIQMLRMWWNNQGPCTNVSVLEHFFLVLSFQFRKIPLYS